MHLETNVSTGGGGIAHWYPRDEVEKHLII